MIDLIWAKNSTIQNIFLLKSLIVYKYDNSRRISVLILSLAINSITYLDICMYDECLNVLTRIDHEFLLWCSISTDRTQILITSFWRIVCFQSFRISSAAFHQRISFYSELHLEWSYTWNLSDWMTWLDQIEINSYLLLYHFISVRFASSSYSKIKRSDACAYFDRLIHRLIDSQNVWSTNSSYHFSFLIDKLSWNRIQLKTQLISSDVCSTSSWSWNTSDFCDQLTH
jgi:hypothetical protein